MHTNTQCVGTLKYYSAIIKNEQLIHVSLWMDPNIIILSERNQSLPPALNILYESFYIKLKKLQSNAQRQKAHQQLSGNGEQYMEQGRREAIQRDMEV